VGVSALRREDQVDVGIAAAGVRPSAHHYEQAVAVALVDEVVAVGAALGPRRAIARLQDRSAVVLDQHRLPFEHDEEFVLSIVPVPLRRPGAGLESHVTDPEVGEPRCGRETAVPPASNLAVEGCGIAGAVHLLDGIEVDLGHGGAINRSAAA
jgi:hypothetical protein